MTSDPSRVFDSRTGGGVGVGYPSCNVELCRVPVNTADPHGYYAELGVEPWASAGRIRSAVRALYRRLHPDTGHRPDPERLQRVKLIAEVLLDPDSRERYNRTPPGRRVLDAVYRSELSRLDLSEVDPGEVQKLLSPIPPDRRDPSYDYLAVDHQDHDAERCQRWYEALLAAAPVVGYRRRIRVLIHDGPAFYSSESALMAVPRDWTPSVGLAFALFTAVAGLVPGTRHARVGTSGVRGMV